MISLHHNLCHPIYTSLVYMFIKNKKESIVNNTCSTNPNNSHGFIVCMQVDA